MNLNLFTPRELIRYEFDNINLIVEQLQDPNTNISVINSFSEEEKQARLNVLTDKIRRMDNFVALFSNFLKESFNINYDDLAPTREFICPYAGGVKLSLNANNKFKPGNLNLKSLNSTVRI